MRCSPIGQSFLFLQIGPVLRVFVIKVSDGLGFLVEVGFKIVLHGNLFQLKIIGVTKSPREFDKRLGQAGFKRVENGILEFFINAEE